MTKASTVLKSLMTDVDSLLIAVISATVYSYLQVKIRFTGNNKVGKNIY